MAVWAHSGPCELNIFAKLCCVPSTHKGTQQASSSSTQSPSSTFFIQLLTKLRPSQRPDTSSKSVSLPLPLRSPLPDFSSLLLVLSSSYVVFRQELAPEEINKLVAVLANPKPYRTPPEFYENRKDGKTFQLLAESADTKLRKTLERMKKASDAGQLS